MPRQNDNTTEEKFSRMFEIFSTVDQKIDLLTRKFGAPNTTLIEVSAICTSTKGARFLAENFERRSLIILNNTAGAVYVHTRSLNNNNATQWMKIMPDGYWEPRVVPTNALYVIGSLGSAVEQEVVGYEGV